MTKHQTGLHLGAPAPLLLQARHKPKRPRRSPFDWCNVNGTFRKLIGKEPELLAAMPPRRRALAISMIAAVLLGVGCAPIPT